MLRQRCIVGCLVVVTFALGGCATTKVVNVPLGEVVTTLDALYVDTPGEVAATTGPASVRERARGWPIGFRRLKLGPTPLWIKVQKFRDSPDQYRLIITEGKQEMEQRTILTARRVTDEETEILAASQDNTRSFFELERDLSYERDRIADVLEMLFTGDLEKTPYYKRGG